MVETSLQKLDWSEFLLQRPDGTVAFDGEKFEQLVRELLRCHFDGVWFGTARSWDGGKDFVDRSIEGQARWAECKMYRQALSLKAISNTLVMAISQQDVRQLLIFSYSRLNRQTRTHLANFSAATGIEVQSFDGDVLRSYVLKTPTALERFFSLDRATARDLAAQREVGALEVSSFFSANPQVDERQLGYVDTPSLSHKIPLRSPCVYQVIVKSSSLAKAGKVTFDFSAFSVGEPAFSILNRNKLNFRKGALELDLLPGQILGEKLYLSFDRSGRQEIPTVPVHTDLATDMLALPERKIDVGFMTRPPLVGGVVLSACKAIEEHASSKHTNLIAAITGVSGVGKSRLLEEIQARLLGENYEIRGLDGAAIAGRGASMFVRTLLARLWRLPDPLVPDLWSDGDPEFDETSSLYDQVCGLIYGDKLDQDWTDELQQQLVSIACQAFQGHRGALLIDNVQALDASSVRILKDISAALLGGVGGSCLIYTFNEQELLHSEAAFSFRQALKDQSVRTPDAAHFIELDEFTEDLVDLFLNEVIQLEDEDGRVLFTERYPSLNALIHEHVLPRPLDLFQLLKAAEDREIVQVEFDCFRILKVEPFHDLVRSLQRSTESILEQRWAVLQSNEAAINILLLVSLFGNVSEIQFNQADIETSSLDYLISAGFVKSRPSGDVCYYHQSIERHFARKLLLDADYGVQHSAARLHEKVIHDVLRDVPPVVAIQLEHLTQSIGRQTLLAALKQFQTLESVPVSSRFEIAARIIEPYLASSYGFVLVADYLPVLYTLCRFISGHQQGELAHILNKYACVLLDYFPENKEAFQQQFWIIRQAGSYARLDHSEQFGLPLLAQALRHLRKLKRNISSDLRARVAADLLDRQCVSYKTQRQYSEAEKCGNKAVRICQAFSVPDVLCLTYIDLGYIYYGPFEKVERLLFYWRKAVSLFETQPTKVTKSNSGMIFACLLVKATVASLEERHDQAIALLDEMIQRAHRDGASFYEVQGLLVKAVVIIRQCYQSKGQIDMETARHLLPMVFAAEDLSVALGMKKFLPDCYFVVAELQAALGQKQGAISRFRMAIEVLVERNEETSSLPAVAELAMLARAREYIFAATRQSPPIPALIEQALENKARDDASIRKPRTSLGLRGIELPCP